MGWVKSEARFYVRYKNREKKLIHDGCYIREDHAALRYNQCIIDAKLTDINHLNSIVDGVPQPQPSYRKPYSEYQLKHLIKSKGVGRLTPKQHTDAINYFLLPIEVYRPADRKWYRGHVTRKWTKVIVKQRVQYDDGDAKILRLRDKPYKGDDAPPCADDGDTSYWRVAAV